MKWNLATHAEMRSHLGSVADPRRGAKRSSPIIIPPEAPLPPPPPPPPLVDLAVALSPPEDGRYNGLLPAPRMRPLPELSNSEDSRHCLWTMLWEQQKSPQKTSL